VSRPAVLVMAATPAIRRRSALEPLLGVDGCARLDAVLLRRAAAGGAAATPGAAFVALPRDVEDDAALRGEGATCFAQADGTAPERLSAAVDEVFAAAGGPVIVVRPDFARLGAYHARAALGDLGDGCDVVLGVAVGGGLYLVGMREPQPRLFALAGNDDDGETTRRNAREVTAGLELEVGMLHYERALVRPGDVFAMLADPLAPADVKDVLEGALRDGGGR
jgi:glycosyltransferase A (GT-A) superfamily protein (DUF2064 family)